jgi:hypothetical protein
MHQARPQQVTHAHEGSPPTTTTTVIRFVNLPSLVFLEKNKVEYFLDRPRII